MKDYIKHLDESKMKDEIFRLENGIDQIENEKQVLTLIEKEKPQEIVQK